MIQNDRMASKRNSFMRLVLEVILRSDALTFLREEDVKRMQDAFICLTPGESSYSIWFELDPTDKVSSRWTRGIINLCLQWSTLNTNFVDDEGSMWSSYKLATHITLREHHQITGDFLDKWMACSSAVNKLLEDIKDLNIPPEVHEMTHTNEQRIVYEKQKAKEIAEKNICNFLLSHEGSVYRKNLRSGGKPKKIPTEIIAPLLGSSSENSYNIVIKDPVYYKWTPRWKYYTLYFFKDAVDSLIIKLK